MCIDIPVTLNTLHAIVHCLATCFDIVYIGHHQADYTLQAQEYKHKLCIVRWHSCTLVH